MMVGRKISRGGTEKIPKNSKKDRKLHFYKLPGGWQGKKTPINSKKRPPFMKIQGVSPPADAHACKLNFALVRLYTFSTCMLIK